MTNYSSWIGRRDEYEETIEATPIRLFSAALDLPPANPTPGDPVPPMWHWMYFVPRVPQSELGADGHPRRGAFDPDVPFRRRMFGGGEATIHRSLRVGGKAVRRREIVDIKEIDGSSGPLVIARVHHEIEISAGLAVSETQTIVYTDSPPRNPDDSIGEAPEAVWREDVETDTALLFRFSALSFNTHRIHYDRAYTREVEGYPDLVVQGPLIALLLCEIARRNGTTLETFRFRSMAPTYVGDTLFLRGTPMDDGVELKAYRGRTLVMDAFAT